MKRLSLSILLILISWTASFSQVSNDTTKCYGLTILKKIAFKLVEGQKCDTLLDICSSQIANRDSVILFKDVVIEGFRSESKLKESIITNKDLEIQNLTADLKKTKRKLFLTKAGWLLTTLSLSGSTLYFFIH